jgi:hypothetical protein
LFELNGKMDAATYRQNLVKSFGDQAAAVEKEYPPPAYDSLSRRGTPSGPTGMDLPVADH